MGARDRLRKYFLARVGRIIGSENLRSVARISEWARRVRELRDEEGYDIQTHNDRDDLKPGQYVLVSAKPRAKIARGIKADQRSKILDRNGFTCQVCGAGAGEPDPLDPSKRIRLQVDHIKPISEGGTNEDSNLRVVCSVCNKGRSNLFIPPEQEAINVLTLIRRKPRDVQLAVLAFLKRKFEGGAS
jgi:hypothetical protein